MRIIKKKKVQSKKDSNEKKVEYRESTYPMRVPKSYRRLERKRKNILPRRNDGKVVGNGVHPIGFRVWGWSAIYIPKRKKLKGWKKENKRFAGIA